MAITIDGDSGISGVNGSATTPALQGTDSNTGIVFGTDTVQVATGGSTRATVDSSGRLLVGTSSNTALGTDSYLSQIKTSGASAGLGIVRTADSVAPPFLSLAKSRNDGIVQSGDFLGKVQFIAHDGNDYNNVSALISSEVDGTPGSDDVPGRLTFHTTADGASSPTERMRIKKTGHINIGTTIDGFANTADNLTIADSGNCGITIRSGTSSAGSLYFSDGTAGSAEYAGYIDYQHNGNHMRFGTNDGTERGRFTSDGDFLLGTTSQFSGSSSSATGHRFEPSGVVSHFRSGGASLYVGRQSNDGIIVSIRQAGNEEGSITVSGSTVSYNGGHLARWSQLAGGVERTEILRGSVLSNLDEMCEWAYEAQDAVLYTEEDELPEGASVGDVKTPAVAAGTENNEQLNRMKVSDVEGDVNVAGVFQAWDDDDDTYTNDFYCAMTGDFIIRIAQGTTVARGDLLMSAGDGTAKPQDDDIVRSKTIAKVTSTTVSTTYSDGSYCVPCVLMAC